MSEVYVLDTLALVEALSCLIPLVGIIVHIMTTVVNVKGWRDITIGGARPRPSWAQALATLECARAKTSETRYHNGQQ